MLDILGNAGTVDDVGRHDGVQVVERTWTIPNRPRGRQKEGSNEWWAMHSILIINDAYRYFASFG